MSVRRTGRTVRFVRSPGYKCEEDMEEREEFGKPRL